MPIVLSDIIQGSEIWFALKAGNVGASNIDKIITTKGEQSKQRTDFMYQLAGERICGKCEETFQSQAMLNGIKREDTARTLFELAYGVEVQKAGIVFKDEKRDSHCSPDGLVGEKKGIEIKNPMMKTHVKYLLAGKLPTEHFGQIQMSLYVTERESWYFMSAYEGLPPLIIEVQRDSAYIAALERELIQFNEELESIVEKLRRK